MRCHWTQRGSVPSDQPLANHRRLCLHYCTHGGLLLRAGVPGESRRSARVCGSLRAHLHGRHDACRNANTQEANKYTANVNCAWNNTGFAQQQRSKTEGDINKLWFRKWSLPLSLSVSPLTPSLSLAHTRTRTHTHKCKNKKKKHRNDPKHFAHYSHLRTDHRRTCSVSISASNLHFLLFKTTHRH